MLNIPLHPVIVHFPIVLATLAPLVALIILIGQRTKRLSSKAWWVATVTLGLLAASSFAAVRTGAADEEVVESVVAESAVKTHEERAEAFALATYVVFAISVLVMVARDERVRAVGRTVTLAGSLVTAGLAISAGHSGGALVYQHGAAAAHVVGRDGTYIDRAPDERLGERHERDQTDP